MLPVVLLMLVAGIGLSQAVSDPFSVTLRWLRLGGLIALGLLGVIAALALVAGDYPADRGAPTALAPAIPFTLQLLLVQKAYRKSQRIAAAAGFVVAVAAACIAMGSQANPSYSEPQLSAHLVPTATALGTAATLAIGSGLLGGFLMTMLLGHAYLTAGGEMTQAPFRRLVLMLGILLAARLLLSGTLGLWPFLHRPDASNHGLTHVWDVAMVTARYAVGLIVPAVFTTMAYDCVQRRSNQSATGILYVTLMLVIIGEGIALPLTRSTGLIF